MLKAHVMDAFSPVRLMAKLKGPTGAGDVKRNASFFFFVIMSKDSVSVLFVCLGKHNALYHK